jgi:hypothetical protein
MFIDAGHKLHTSPVSAERCYVQFVEKVTSALASQIEEADDDGLLDVVVELDEPETPAPVPRADRRAAMEAMKEKFDADAEPVQRSIRSCGGEVIGAAWINRTLRARVPARSIAKLSEEARVAAVDVPRPLEPESA